MIRLRHFRWFAQFVKGSLITLLMVLLSFGASALQAQTLSPGKTLSPGTSKQINPFKPLTCDSPFVANKSKTACVCPRGTVRRGNSCAPTFTDSETVAPRYRLHVPGQ